MDVQKQSQTIRARSEPTMNSPAEPATEQGVLGVVVQGFHTGKWAGRTLPTDCFSWLWQCRRQRGGPAVPLFSAPRLITDIALLSPTHSPTDGPPHMVSPAAGVSCGCGALGLPHWLGGHLRSDPQSSSSSDVLEGRGSPLRSSWCWGLQLLKVHHPIYFFLSPLTRMPQSPAKTGGF